MSQGKSNPPMLYQARLKFRDSSIRVGSGWGLEEMEPIVILCYLSIFMSISGSSMKVNTFLLCTFGGLSLGCRGMDAPLTARCSCSEATSPLSWALSPFSALHRHDRTFQRSGFRIPVQRTGGFFADTPSCHPSNPEDPGGPEYCQGLFRFR